MADGMNAAIWFEIPVADMERGKAFYEAVFGEKLTVVDMGHRLMAMFPMEMGVPGIGGALVKEETFVPSRAGSMVYFAVADITAALDRVVAQGGRILVPKTAIGEYGYCGYFVDSEGNRVGLHSM